VAFFSDWLVPFFGGVFITHNVRHALAVGDLFTVLSRGQTLGTVEGA